MIITFFFFLVKGPISISKRRFLLNNIQSLFIYYFLFYSNLLAYHVKCFLLKK